MALFGPFFAASPSGFIRDVWWFQTSRVADGDMDRWFRLKDMLPERRLGVVVLVLLGLAVAVVRTVWTRGKDWTPERFVALAYVLSLAANLLARSYWSTYNAFLAPAEALLAGLGAGALVGWGATLGREWGRRVAFALVVLIPFHLLLATLLERCDFTILGWRGRWQLSPENYQWFEANHGQRVSSEHWLKLDIWERTGR